jgi:hypothetical protein
MRRCHKKQVWKTFFKTFLMNFIKRKKMKNENGKKQKTKTINKTKTKQNKKRKQKRKKEINYGIIHFLIIYRTKKKSKYL